MVPVCFDAKDGKAFLSWRKVTPDRRWIMPIGVSTIITKVSWDTTKKRGTLATNSKILLKDIKPSKLQ